MATKSLVELDKEFEEYKKFAFSQNLLGMAIAVIMSNAVQKVVNAISEDVLMPIINFIVRSAGTNWKQMHWVVMHGLVIEYGKLLSSIIEFVVSTLVIYLIYFKVLRFFYPDLSLPTKPT